MQNDITRHDLTMLTSEIVCAYLNNNTVSMNDVPDMIANVHVALENLNVPKEAIPEPVVPAVPVKKSVTHDHVVCLECGFKAKMLKRHIRNEHGLEIAEYRARYGLAEDHPLTAPAYSARRAELAKQIGLGQLRKGK